MDIDGRGLLPVLVCVAVIATGTGIYLAVEKLKGKTDKILHEKEKMDAFLEDPMNRNPGNTLPAVADAMATGVELLREVPGTSINPYFSPTPVNPADELTQEMIDALSELINAYQGIGGAIGDSLNEEECPQ